MEIYNWHCKTYQVTWPSNPYYWAQKPKIYTSAVSHWLKTVCQSRKQSLATLSKVKKTCFSYAHLQIQIQTQIQMFVQRYYHIIIFPSMEKL